MYVVILLQENKRYARRRRRGCERESVLAILMTKYCSVHRSRGDTAILLLDAFDHMTHELPFSLIWSCRFTIWRDSMRNYVREMPLHASGRKEIKIFSSRRLSLVLSIHVHIFHKKSRQKDRSCIIKRIYLLSSDLAHIFASTLCFSTLNLSHRVMQ